MAEAIITEISPMGKPNIVLFFFIDFLSTRFAPHFLSASLQKINLMSLRINKYI